MHSSYGKRVLQEAGLPYIDPTSCLLDVSPSFIPHRGIIAHRKGNVSGRECLAGAVREALIAVWWPGNSEAEIVVTLTIPSR